MKYGVRATFGEDRGSVILEVHNDQRYAWQKKEQFDAIGNGKAESIANILNSKIVSYDVVGLGQ